MTVADQIADYLASQGVTHAFGIVGGANLALFEAMARRMEVISCHHEQGAAIAAAYYYRTCRRIAPCLVTAGGGAMNAMTGVQEAQMDSIPLLVISGNELSRMFDRPHTRSIGFQGFDVAEVVKPFTKHSERALSAEAGLHEVRLAYSLAIRPRQGACWVDIAQDHANAVV